MAASNREASISKTLTYEGGYTNDPRDPGGATNYGITIHDARMYWKPEATPADVKAMPKSVAIEIYRQKYWAKMGCDERPAGPDFVDFDYGVNSGTGRVFALRKKLDPKALQPVDYVKQACAARSAFLHSLRTWAVFGKGWGSRVADVEATGVRMATGAAGKPVAPVLKQEAKKASTKAIAHGTAGATVGPASIPAVHHVDPLGTIAGCIVIALAALGALYFIWHFVQASHRANAYNAQLTQA